MSPSRLQKGQGNHPIDHHKYCSPAPRICIDTGSYTERCHMYLKCSIFIEVSCYGDETNKYSYSRRVIIYSIYILTQSLKLSSSSRSRSSKSSPRSKSSLSFPNFERRFVSFSRGFSGLVSGSISPAVKT